MIKLKREMIKLKGGADSPGIGKQPGALCRVVGDADPYDVRKGLLAFCTDLLYNESISNW